MLSTTEYNARLAANEKKIRAAIAKMGFAANRKFGDRDCFDLGTVRVAFFSDDERLEVYAFDGAPGTTLKYEIGLPYSPSVPVEVVTGTITSIVAAELR